MLAAIRRRHGVKLPKVRKALDYMERQFSAERPLIDQAFRTDGLDLFVERYGHLINASRAGQHATKEIIGIYLKRISFGRPVIAGTGIPASSDAKPPDGTVFFIDRSLGVEPIRTELINSGLTVEIHDDHFVRDEQAHRPRFFSFWAEAIPTMFLSTMSRLQRP